MRFSRAKHRQVSTSLGNRIAAWRGFRGLSSAELARAVRVSRAAVSVWQSDRGRPTIEHLDALIAALGTDWATFFGRIPRRRVRR